MTCGERKDRGTASGAGMLAASYVVARTHGSLSFLRIITSVTRPSRGLDGGMIHARMEHVKKEE